MAVFCQKKMQFPRSIWTILNTPGSHSVGDESPWGGFWLMVLAQPAGFWTLPSWVEWPPRPGREGQPLVRFLRRWGSAFLRKGGNAAHFLRSGMALNGMFNHICLHLDCHLSKTSWNFTVSFLQGRIFLKSWRWHIGSWANSPNEVSLCDRLQTHSAHQITTRAFSGFFWLMLFWARLEKKGGLQANWV